MANEGDTAILFSYPDLIKVDHLMSSTMLLYLLPMPMVRLMEVLLVVYKKGIHDSVHTGAYPSLQEIVCLKPIAQYLKIKPALQ